MRKHYLYAVFLAVLALMMWFGSYYYTELQKNEYKNGTLVQMEPQNTEFRREISA